MDFGTSPLRQSTNSLRLTSHDTAFQAVHFGAFAPANATAPPTPLHHAGLEPGVRHLESLTGLLANSSRGDADRDGVGDAVEKLAPHGGDGNQDGIQDRQQSSVASLRSAGGQMVTLDAGGHALRGVRAHAAPRDAEISLPYGLFSFEISNLTPAGSATLRMILPEEAAPRAYFKEDAAGRLSRFDFDGATGARIAGHVVTLHYVDGGRGDADGLANGVIVDPGGPGQYPPVVTAGPDVQGAECQPITINGGISDPNGPSMFPPYIITINWGDGSQNSSLSMMSPGPFSSTHTYADDGTYTITVTGTDPTGLIGTDTAQATIGTVQSVEWIDNYAGQLDANPPEIGGGKRVFPDRLQGDTPEQAGARRWVKLRVTVGVPNVEVYITIMDVDDPSTNHPDVDSETGSDNRGLGGLSFPPQTTNAAGIVELAFQVSMQPGDNYRAVATTHLPALASIYAKQDDGTQARIFDAAPDPDTPLPNDKAKVSELLTVWRRLHVEVDSMGAVQGNTIQGQLTGAVIDFVNSTAVVTTDQNLQDSVNRFVPGTLTNTGSQFPVTANTNGPNFQVTISLPQGQGLPLPGTFTLRDDDVLQDGQDVPMPDTSKLDVAMNEAYVKVFFDVGNNNNVTFHLNVDAQLPPPDPLPANHLLKLIQDNWDSRLSNMDNFWVAYVLGAFQPPKAVDNDPNAEPSGDGVTPSTGGSLIFLETLKDSIREWNSAAPPADRITETDYERDTVVHEVGHAVGRSLSHPVTGFDGLQMGQRAPQTLPHNEPSRYVPQYLALIRSAARPWS